MQREARFFGGLLSFLYLCAPKNADIKKDNENTIYEFGKRKQWELLLSRY